MANNHCYECDAKLTPGELAEPYYACEGDGDSILCLSCELDDLHKLYPDRTLSAYFQEAHALGAKEFGTLWFAVHRDLSTYMLKLFDISDPKIKATIAVAVLRTMRTYRAALNAEETK